MIIGTTTTVLTDGAATNPIVIDGNGYTAVAGDVVLYGNITSEYLFNGTVWHLIGTGDSSSPFIVYCWTDFLKVNYSGYSVKFANPHEVDGEIVLSGTGTQANPYIVSTYEEMLSATHATYIWQVKLFDREQKIYRYNDIYCRYDDSQSTIDFSLIWQNGCYSTFSVNVAINLNGWTWKNAVFHENGCFRFLFSMSNAIFKDFFSDSKISTGSCISCASSQASNIKMSGTFDTNGNCVFGVMSGSNSAFRGLINSSFDFTLLGKSKMFGDSGNAYSPKMENCNITFKLIDNRTTAVSLGNGIECYNCLFSGNIKAPNSTASCDTSTQLLYSGSRYDIINITAEVEEGHNKPNINLISDNPTSLVIYRNDGNVDYYSTNYSNLIGVPESTLKDAQALHDLGLPIGVD